MQLTQGRNFFTRLCKFKGYKLTSIGPPPDYFRWQGGSAVDQKLAIGCIRSGDGAKKSDPSKLVASLLCHVGLFAGTVKNRKRHFWRLTPKLNHIEAHQVSR